MGNGISGETADHREETNFLLQQEHMGNEISGEKYNSEKPFFQVLFSFTSKLMLKVLFFSRQTIYFCVNKIPFLILLL